MYNILFGLLIMYLGVFGVSFVYNVFKYCYHSQKSPTFWYIWLSIKDSPKLAVFYFVLIVGLLTNATFGFGNIFTLKDMNFGIWLDNMFQTFWYCIMGHMFILYIFKKRLVDDVNIDGMPLREYWKIKLKKDMPLPWFFDYMIFFQTSDKIKKLIDDICEISKPKNIPTLASDLVDVIKLKNVEVK